MVAKAIVMTNQSKMAIEYPKHNRENMMSMTALSRLFDDLASVKRF